LRQRIRKERRSVPAQQRASVERALCRHIRALGAFKRARRIGIFLAFDGEPSLEPLIKAALRQHKQLFLPVLRGLQMQFAPYAPGADLARNFFGILEPPRGSAPIDPRHLDLILTPLVAFDARGVRLGVGRGYYDRCFGFLLHRNRWRRPKLLGVGYEFQHVPYIEMQAWDVPLWGAVTELGVREFHWR
jgi:5-formyltetrahydrofolate cyclo-ligase